MEQMKTVGKVIAVVLGFGLWVVACPEVKTTQEQGRCWEQVTYAAVYTKLREIEC